MKEFSYGKEGIALSILPGIMILILLILLVALIPGLVIIPWALVSGLPVSLSMVVSYVAVFIACVYGLALLLAQINQYNTIRIMEGGLRITTFGPFLFWKFIPWQDIISLGIAPQKDRWGQPVWVIKVKELTWWHKYLAKMFQMGPNPMITLTSDMEDREQLAIPSPISLKEQALWQGEYGPKRPLCGKAGKLNCHRVFAEAFVLSPSHNGNLGSRPSNPER